MTEVFVAREMIKIWRHFFSFKQISGILISFIYFSTMDNFQVGVQSVDIFGNVREKKQNFWHFGVSIPSKLLIADNLYDF